MLVGIRKVNQVRPRVAASRLPYFDFKFDDCVTTKDFYKTVSAKVDGEHIIVNYCPNCLKYREIERKCLRCNMQFQPTCGNTHLCVYCRDFNQNTKEGMHDGFC